MTEPSLKDDLNRVLDAIETLTSEDAGNPDRDKLGYNLALRFHAFALQRDLERLQALVAAAREAGRPGGVASLEEGFWRVDAACEKIMAILCLALGVHAVVVRDGRLFFRPNEDPARSKAVAELRKRAATSHQVRRLAEIYEQLVVAIRYRNQVSHGLSSIDNTFRAPFVAVYLDSDLNVRRIEPSHLVPEGVLDGSDISAAALFTRALDVAEQASDLLREALPALAATIKSGVIRPGPFVFYRELEDGTPEVFAVPPASSDTPSGDEGEE